MRVLLRLIGIVEVLSGVVATLLLIHLLTGTRTAPGIGVLLLAGSLVIGAPVFMFAGVELLRLKERGRRVSLILMVLLGALTIGLAVVQGRILPHQVVRLGVEVASVLLLASAAARRATRPAAQA